MWRYISLGLIYPVSKWSSNQDLIRRLNIWRILLIRPRKWLLRRSLVTWCQTNLRTLIILITIEWAFYSILKLLGPVKLCQASQRHQQVQLIWLNSFQSRNVKSIKALKSVPMEQYCSINRPWSNYKNNLLSIICRGRERQKTRRWYLISSS